jgi:hypothetical protein
MALTKKPTPPTPRTVTPTRDIDQSFLIACDGSRFVSIGLPSGDTIAAVDDHIWRVVVVAGPTVKVASAVLEPRSGMKGLTT